MSGYDTHDDEVAGENARARMRSGLEHAKAMRADDGFDHADYSAKYAAEFGPRKPVNTLHPLFDEILKRAGMQP